MLRPIVDVRLEHRSQPFFLTHAGIEIVNQAGHVLLGAQLG